MEYIKCSIMESKLPQILDFVESDINWIKAKAYATHSLIRDASDMFNNGDSIPEIAIRLQKDIHTIRIWLKQATKIGWCSYIPQKPCKVYCIEMNQIFESKREAARAARTSAASINNYLKGLYKHAGIHPETSSPSHWELIEES